MLIPPELGKYISEARLKGTSDKAIRQNLENANWRAEDIDVALSAPVPIGVPSVEGKRVGRNRYLLAFLIVLVFGLGVIIVLPQTRSVVGIYALGLFKVKPSIQWAAYEAKSIELSQYPFLERYGYATGTVDIFPNTLSSLYVVPTKIIAWPTDDGEMFTDLLKSYLVSSVIVFSRDSSFLKVMPLPKVASTSPSVAWLGNRYILVHEFVPEADTLDSGNYFFVG